MDCPNFIKYLSEDEIESVRKATEDVIANTGFRVMNTKALRMARSAGAIVDEASKIVRIPVPLLRELLSMVPSSYNIAGLDETETVIGGENQVCVAIVTDPWVIDYNTGKPRRPCLDDMRKHTIIAQKLDDVAAISRMDFPVTDFNDATSSLRALEAHLLNHKKHNFVLPASLESWNEWQEIGEILLDGRKLPGSGLISVGAAIISPMTISDINVEIMFSACKNSFAVVPTVCPMAGTTSPYSLAAILLQGNVENVFIAALTQVINPGNPFEYTFGPSVTEMRNGHDLYYTLDKVLLKVAGVQMAKSYNMPVGAECGGSLTYRYDQQNGAEGMLFMLAAYASKADILAGIGSCHNANGMSAEMMIIQDEWLKAARFLGRGINTGLLLRGLESIKNAGPGANFLTDDLTVDLLRSDEFFSSSMLDFSGGYHEAPSMLERAHEKVESLVSGFKSPVPAKIQDNIREYFDRLYKRIYDGK